MLFSQQKVLRTLAPLLVFCISQLYIQASLTKPNKPAQDPQAAVTGRLEIRGKKQILVDSRDTEAGVTIVNGQTLETSDCSSATVHLLSASSSEMGAVELGINSKAVINYSPGSVKVTLISGCARVRTSSGLNATISSPDGTLLPNDACYPSGSKKDYSPSCVPVGGPPPGGGVSPGVWAAVTAGAATGIGLTYLNVCNRAADTSPIAPNANQCQ